MISDLYTLFIHDQCPDKTQIFHDQIEAKQKELQPWTKQINQKQARINIAQSERDTLVKKAEQAQAASEEAREALETLQADQAAKVRLTMARPSPRRLIVPFSFRITSLGRRNARKPRSLASSGLHSRSLECVHLSLFIGPI